MEDEGTLEAGASWQTWLNGGTKYCPDMDNILLPSYFPANYKPGHSGDRAEQWPLRTLNQTVCLICRNGPRCEVTHKTKTGLDGMDYNLCANNPSEAHNIQITVSSVQLYSQEGRVLAHSYGKEESQCHESFNNNICDLIEIWRRGSG